MEPTMLETACRAAGMLESAVPDGVARLSSHFAQQASPTPALISEQLLRLRSDAPHLFPSQPSVDIHGVPVGVAAEVWQALSPSEKLTYARQLQPPPVAQRRPKPLVLSSEQAAHLATLPPAQRLDAYRALQDQGKG